MKKTIYAIAMLLTLTGCVNMIPTNIIGGRSGNGELVVIDAGHGGHDSGAIGGDQYEKTLVLQIAKKVKNSLQNRGYRVYLTRDGDRFLKLSQRTHIADVKNAKVFVSIHANAAPTKNRYRAAHGIETYFLQKTRDAKSQRIAKRENESVLQGTDSLSKNVIIDSVLNGPKIVQSHKLAIDVQNSIVQGVKNGYGGVKDGGVRPAPFYVLVGASRPSILVEVGYITNPQERARLFKSDYQKRIADGIANGIGRYLKNRERELGI